MLSPAQVQANDDRVGAIGIGPYRGNKVKREYGCVRCGQSFFCIPNTVWTNAKNTCNVCSRKKHSENQTLTPQQVAANDKRVGCIPKAPYTKSMDKRLYGCPLCHKDFLGRPAEMWHRNVPHCGACGHIMGGLKIAFNEEEATRKDEECEMKRLTPYEGARIKAQYLCPTCGEPYWVIPASVWAGLNRQCNPCRLKQFAYIGTQATDMTGLKCGLLTVLQREGTATGGDDTLRATWLCECKCGRTTVVIGKDLRSGNTRSCGLCINKSFGESRILDILQDLNYTNYNHQHKLDGFLTVNDRQMRLDFYLPEWNIIVEYHGNQHYNNPFTEQSFVYTVANDKLRRQHAQTRGVGLCEIPYTYFDQLEELITELVETGTMRTLVHPKTEEPIHG